ncbi:signal recognition particle, SRP9/SRP14 subunit [Pleurotus eryngii]|uniref:Signal recognition particle, SRP9/SRP14 subunit n=1 Tax=Pleurotus eryngii TaxID=5323 RepID=A0A9P5ZUR0_PLEER|nr:signal recognition particle, SRP9/SRP14 subunit [Pleurotus eryngii]
MVYISVWQDFQEAAEALYTKSPNNARYCVKWKSSEGKLVLKITDNTTCIKFKTNSSIFLNRFEVLNVTLMRKMQNRQPTPEPTPPPTEKKASGFHDASGAATPPAPSPVPGASAGPSGGVKKKKPKKKK